MNFNLHIPFINHALEYFFLRWEDQKPKAYDGNSC